jgi:hypothetical protein
LTVATISRRLRSYRRGYRPRNPETTGCIRIVTEAQFLDFGVLAPGFLVALGLRFCILIAEINELNQEAAQRTLPQRSEIPAVSLTASGSGLSFSGRSIH